MITGVPQPWTPAPALRPLPGRPKRRTLRRWRWLPAVLLTYVSACAYAGVMVLSLLPALGIAAPFGNSAAVSGLSQTTVWFVTIGYHVLLILHAASFVATARVSPGHIPLWLYSREPGDQAYFHNVLQAVEKKLDGSLRFCRKCGAFKPDLAHHSSQLGLCVLSYQHWDLWSNSAIGKPSRLQPRQSLSAAARQRPNCTIVMNAPVLCRVLQLQSLPAIAALFDACPLDESCAPASGRTAHVARCQLTAATIRTRGGQRECLARLNILALHICVCSYMRLLSLTTDRPHSRIAVRFRPQEHAVFAFAGLAVMTSIVMGGSSLLWLLFHSLLIARGQTAHTFFRQGGFSAQKPPKASLAGRSPFHFGVASNFGRTCGKQPLLWCLPTNQGVEGNGIFFEVNLPTDIEAFLPFRK